RRGMAPTSGNGEQGIERGTPFPFPNSPPYLAHILPFWTARRLEELPDVSISTGGRGPDPFQQRTKRPDHDLRGSATSTTAEPAGHRRGRLGAAGFGENGQRDEHEGL